MFLCSALHILKAKNTFLPHVYTLNYSENKKNKKNWLMNTLSNSLDKQKFMKIPLT